MLPFYIRAIFVSFPNFFDNTLHKIIDFLKEKTRPECKCLPTNLGKPVGFQTNLVGEMDKSSTTSKVVEAE